MKINVHIERIVLDGLPGGAADRKRVTAALAGELARMLRGGLSDEIAAGGAFERIRGGTLTLGRGAAPVSLAAGIARAVRDGIGKRDTTSARTPDRRTRE